MAAAASWHAAQVARATPGLTPEDQACVAAQAAKWPARVADFLHLIPAPAEGESWEEVAAPREPHTSTYKGSRWVKYARAA